jgi:hypothetical protein
MRSAAHTALALGRTRFTVGVMRRPRGDLFGPRARQEGLSGGVHDERNKRDAARQAHSVSQGPAFMTQETNRVGLT